MRRPTSSSNGSALVWTVLIVSILSFAAAEMLQIISGKYHTTLQTAVWQEALLAAHENEWAARTEFREELHPGRLRLSRPTSDYEPSPTGPVGQARASMVSDPPACRL